VKEFLLDTNYILRYLLNDIPSQADIVEAYLKQARKGLILIYVPILTFVEAGFILKSVYKFEKNLILDRITHFAKIPFLLIEKKEILHYAISLFREKNISFIDSLFVAESKITGKILLTFDK
jgi:predicted nucleic-acid-binding protein